MSEVRECPRCGYTTEVYDDKAFGCPECPADAQSLLRRKIWIMHDYDAHAVEGPILEPLDAPKVDIMTRGDVIVCPVCGSPVDDVERVSPGRVSFEPCECQATHAQANDAIREMIGRD